MINTGISFGWQIPGTEFLGLVLIIVLFYIWSRDWRVWGWGLIILGGGLNLGERFLIGGVRDYWLIPGTSIYNNINDYLIALGVGELIIYFLWKKRQK
ncbi:MAG: signal peptidase II [Candidatus Shapirobacteria bacterium]|jgi:lipoprotein signal peptidase